MAKQKRHLSKRSTGSVPYLWLALIGVFVLAVVVAAFSSAMPKGTTDAPAAASKNPEPRVTTESAPASTPKVTPPATPAPAPTLPEQMAHVPASTRQLIVITGRKLGSNAGTLEVYNKDGQRWVRALSVPADFGKSGLVDGLKRRQGHLQTPTGIWSISDFVFGLHPTAPSGTKMPYRRITKDSYWSSSQNSTYNTWVESKTRVAGEHLADADPQYEYAFNSGYNSPPNTRVFGRGTAIFIHCSEPPGNSLGVFTHGCIAIPRDRIVQLLDILDPARHPWCAIGTLEAGTSTSIKAY